MDGQRQGWTDGEMDIDGWMKGRTERWMDGEMDGWRDGWTDE